MVRDPQKELDALLERKRGLEDSLTKREQELKELRREKKTLLERQIARATSRLNARERKLRTRKLILIGSYMEHTTKDDHVRPSAALLTPFPSGSYSRARSSPSRVARAALGRPLTAPGRAGAAVQLRGEGGFRVVAVRSVQAGWNHSALLDLEPQ